MGAEQTEVGILCYPGAQYAAVLAMTNMFEVSNRFKPLGTEPDKHGITVSHWQIARGDGSPVRILGATGHTGPDVLIIPPCLGGFPSAELAMPYIAWLRNLHSAGCIIASVCAGVFILAETGLLDGKATTTLGAGRPLPGPLSKSADRSGSLADRWRPDPDRWRRDVLDGPVPAAG
jgi:transcriptional regulator GlxA family with amidase domain